MKQIYPVIVKMFEDLILQTMQTNHRFFGNDIDWISVTFCDLLTGKNKFTFSCHSSSVLYIINSNINS